MGGYQVTLTAVTPTSLSGLIKGSGGKLAAAVAGTDYLTPSGSGAALTGFTASQIPSLDAGKVTTGTFGSARIPDMTLGGDLSGTVGAATVAKVNGVSYSSDCLTQYALLAGRSGGQIIKGDTLTGGNLTLMSTGHATKGKVVFGLSAYDEVNDRLGLGTTSPGVKLDLSVASGSVFTRMNCAAGSQALHILRDGGTDKWQFGKQTDNTFIIYNSVTGKVVMSISGNDVTFNTSGAGNSYFADSVRIGSATAPAYTCDVTGDINCSGAIRQAGVAIAGTSTSQAGNYTILSGETMTLVTAAATVTLPDPSGFTLGHTKRIFVTGNAYTVNLATAAGSIIGATTTSISRLFSCVSSGGSVWYVI